MISELGDSVSQFQRSPSSPSLLYSSRRKFLASAGKSCIEVPPEFQTRRQAQRKNLQRRDHLFDSKSGDDDDDSISSYLPAMSLYTNVRASNLFAAKKDRFQNLLPNAKLGAGKLQDNPNIVPKRMRRAGKFSLGLVILESTEFDSNQENWREETRAGVTYWIHKDSGEIVTECPWLRKRNSLLQFSNSRKRLIKSPGNPSFSETNDSGTGSLVYDGSEVDELFKLLEQIETNKSASASSSPIKYARDSNYACDSPMSIKSI